MIDFTATHEQNGIIGFENDKGETVKSYPLSELEQFVIDKQLNIISETVHVSGSGIPCDPNNTDEEIETEQSVSDFIDNNWEWVTKAFYIDRNPSEFKSFNNLQETRRVG